MSSTFIVEQKKLLSILSSMQPICAKRTTVDATTSILFQVSHKELNLKSTDLEISLQATCPMVESSFSDTQTFLVPGKKLFDLIKELDGSIECTVADQQLSLKAGSAFLSLNIKDPEAFPPFPERIENLTSLEASFLIDLLDKVSFLIPQNNANPSLNGLFLEFSSEGLTMTTTDGHCLAQVTTSKYTLEESKQWLLPRRAVFEIKKILENTENSTIFLGVCGNQVVFSGETFNFFTKLLNNQFPQYQTILQRDGFQPAVLDREQFVKTLRRSSCLLSGQFLATKFSFAKDVLRVSMDNKEVGSLNEDLPLQFDSTAVDIRFYAPYLLSGLQVFDQKDITFYLKNETRPVIFHAERPEYHLLYLVMPVSPTNNAQQ